MAIVILQWRAALSVKKTRLQIRADTELKHMAE